MVTCQCDESDAINLNLCIRTGVSFSSDVMGWASAVLVHKAISAITQAAPASITATGHGLPDGWPFRVTGVGGMLEINSPDDDDSAFYIADVVDANTVEINDLDSSRFGAYTDGGYIRYYEPQDLAGFTAKAQVRESETSETVLLELTSGAGEIVLDNTAKSITIVMTDEATALLDPDVWANGVYDLLLTSSGGDVYRIAYGTVTVLRGVTVS